MSDLALYSYFRSSASYRARIALHWKGLSFKYLPVHLLKQGGEQNTDQYRTLNPAAEVPTLVHGKHVISQSMAILQYLDEVFPAKALFPRDPYLKAKVIQFCEGINCIQPYQNLRTLQVLEKDFGFLPAQKDRWTQFWIARNMESSEKILQSTAGTHCFGGEITAAEVFLVPQIFAAQRFGVDINQYPTIARVYNNCKDLEAFKAAHPLNQIDTPDELKK